MKLKSLLFVLGLASAITANANDYSYSLGDITGIIEPVATFSHDKNSFTDRFFFSLDAPSFGTASVSNNRVNKFGGGSLYNIEGLTLSVYQDRGTVGAADGADIGTVLGIGNYVYSDGLLAAGNYYLQIAGNASGDLGGRYTAQATAMPVPEADTYAMMIAGLGLMGGIARRRKQK